MHHELPAPLDLEWYRKQAKTLVRDYRAGDADTVARVEEGLGDRAAERFRLSDAQWLIAREHGHGSWATFARWVAAREPEPPVGRIGRQPVAAVDLGLAFERVWAVLGERGEAALDSGLRYGGVEPVLVHVSKRERRYSFSDRGAAFAAAGRPRGWRETGDAVEEAYVVNVSRSGEVFLPAVERDLAWLSSLPERIAEASVAFYGALLELDE
jgi:hypothetical protein